MANQKNGVIIAAIFEFGGVSRMKSKYLSMLVALSVLMLSGCSMQMIAGADGSVGYGNLTEGDAFMAANKGREGVVELFSGIQYKVLREGTGITPNMDDKVVVMYTGKTIEGEVFDSTRGATRTYPVTKMMSGLQTVILRMQEGAKWEVYLPPEFAYGERSAGPLVGPNSTVIYELELIKAY